MSAFGRYHIANRTTSLAALTEGSDMQFCVNALTEHENGRRPLKSPNANALMLNVVCCYQYIKLHRYVQHAYQIKNWWYSSLKNVSSGHRKWLHFITSFT